MLPLGLGLELVVGHGDDGEDQVDQVERPQQDVQDEEGDVHRAGGAKGYLRTTGYGQILILFFFMHTTIKFKSQYTQYSLYGTGCRGLSIFVDINKYSITGCLSVCGL